MSLVLSDLLPTYVARYPEVDVSLDLTSRTSELVADSIDVAIRMGPLPDPARRPLGHSLGMLTVAEGVETEETVALLRGLGCDIGQGWLFGCPVPAHEIDTFVAQSTEKNEPVLTLVA